MTEEEANNMLLTHEWTKFADASELLQTAAHMGAVAERERWRRVVMAELDSNGQAHAIVFAATKA